MYIIDKIGVPRSLKNLHSSILCNYQYSSTVQCSTSVRVSHYFNIAATAAAACSDTDILTSQ